MDIEKIKKLAQQILSACGDSEKEEEDDTEEYEDSAEDEGDEEESAPSAMSGKNLAVLVALKKKMGKK